MKAPSVRRIHAAMIALMLLAALVAILIDRSTPTRAPRTSGQQARRAEAPSAVTPAAPLPPAGPMVIVDGTGRRVPAAGPISASAKFRDAYPAQPNATRTEGVPASNYWAVMIGINDYAGPTRDNIGS